MATILVFTRIIDQDFKDTSAQAIIMNEKTMPDAEIIIFPGVRIERTDAQTSQDDNIDPLMTNVECHLQ